MPGPVPGGRLGLRRREQAQDSTLLEAQNSTLPEYQHA